MHSRWIHAVFAVAAVAMIITSLWLWQFAPAMAMQYRVAERSVFAMGGRCAAVALAAAAQWLLIGSVIGAMYRPGRADQFFCRLAALTSGIACVAAVALGLAAR